MLKKIPSTILTLGNQILKEYMISFSSSYSKVNFRRMRRYKNNGNATNKIIVVKKDGLYDNNKLVTEYNNEWVYALNLKLPYSIRVGNGRKIDKNDNKYIRGYRRNKKQFFKVTDFVILGNYKNLCYLAQEDSSHEWRGLFENQVKFYERSYIFNEKKGIHGIWIEKDNNDVTRQKLEEILKMPSCKVVTKVIREERNKGIVHDFVNEIPKSRIEEKYNLSKSQLNRIIKEINDDKTI